MNKILFRYMINEGVGGMWLGKKGRWVKQEKALHFSSLKKAQETLSKIGHGQIWEVPYERGLPRQHSIMKSFNWINMFNSVPLSFPNHPIFPYPII